MNAKKRLYRGRNLYYISPGTLGGLNGARINGRMLKRSKIMVCICFAKMFKDFQSFQYVQKVQ